MGLMRHLRLIFNVIAIVAVLIAAKFAFHALHLEFLTLDTLFSSVVAGAIFILGFLLTSTLPDFKEAEHLPANIRASLEGMHDDIQAFAAREPRIDMARLRAMLTGIVSAIEKGLGPEGHHAHLEDAMARADALSPFIAELDGFGMANNYVVRLRNLQDALRKSIYRISYIQKIEFVPSANALIQSLVVAVIFLLLCLRTDGSWGTYLIFGFVSYLFVFAIHLIAVFQQPFRQGEHSVDKVSLYLLREFAAKLNGATAGANGRR